MKRRKKSERRVLRVAPRFCGECECFVPVGKGDGGVCEYWEERAKRGYKNAMVWVRVDSVPCTKGYREERVA